MKKDLAVVRGVVMMALLLVSMYFVFSTVADKFESEKEPDEKEAIEQLNKLLEDFEVITPEPSAANIENPSSKLVEMEDDLRLTDALAEKIRQEQDVSDKKRARTALAESIKRGEANRLLEQVAEPLLEKQDVRLESDLLDGEELANSIDSLVESLETNTPKDKPSPDTSSNNP